MNIIGHHTAISVSDIEKSMEWYHRVLGFKPEMVVKRPDMGATIGMMSLQEYHLELFCFKDYNPLPEYRKNLLDDLKTIGTKHLALGVENIDEVVEELSEKGVFFPEKPKLGATGHRYTFFHDPDRILIELYELKNTW